MASGLKQIQERAKSIKNIQKVTNSMKMVSAARFVQAERQLKSAKPFGLAAAKFYDFAIKSPGTDHLVAFTSDRGLCGSAHSRICRHAMTLSGAATEDTPGLVCIGEKARLILGFRMPRKIRLVVNGIGHRIPTFVGASRIAKRCLQLEGWRCPSFLFAEFVNMLSFDIVRQDFASLAFLQGTSEILVYDFPSFDDLASYLEFSLSAVIYRALVESYCVELSARVNAMSNASKNADNVYKALQSKFNRNRQSSITRDLIDVVSGASVVVAKKKPQTKRVAVS